MVFILLHGHLKPHLPTSPILLPKVGFTEAMVPRHLDRCSRSSDVGNRLTRQQRWWAWHQTLMPVTSVCRDTDGLPSRVLSLVIAPCYRGGQSWHYKVCQELTTQLASDGTYTKSQVSRKPEFKLLPTTHGLRSTQTTQCMWVTYACRTESSSVVTSTTTTTHSHCHPHLLV